MVFLKYIFISPCAIIISPCAIIFSWWWWGGWVPQWPG